ncbi:hypothetical protein [Hymenobacter lapidiphilus]|uniref:hypothetical protein n=1 Tax=Hymenobacter sp. CCM 8763 TaxID=2303334 RepID=UPI00167ECD8F|nr:hypothetical protein [Hymenobacter sp. CCM 8763]
MATQKSGALQAGQLAQKDEDAQGQIDTEALELLFGLMMCTHARPTPAQGLLVRGRR